MYKYSVCGTENGRLRCYRRNDGKELPGKKCSRLDCNKIAARCTPNWQWVDLWDTGMQYQRDMRTKIQVVVDYESGN